MIGTALGGYRIVKELGEGGMGIVYEAVDTALDRRVALKVLHSEYSRNPELLERFRAEAKAQANLNHANIATLYTFVVEGGQAGMVMEYVEGENIAQILERRGLLPSDYAIPLFRQALLGIGYAHRRGIIHRDIKPSNLMVDPQGMVKVMDFGIAKVLGSRGMTRTGTQMGTAFYMSPEQITSKGVDIRSDIYSLGATLYEMLTANVPFQGDSDFQIMSAHLNQPPPPPSRYYPYIPKGVENAVLKALEKSPEARFQTVEEFGAALERPEDFRYAVASASAPAGRETIIERPSARTAPRMAAVPLTPPPLRPPQPAQPPIAQPPIAEEFTAAETSRADVPPPVVQPPQPRGLPLESLLSTPRRKLAVAGVGLVALIGIGLALRPKPEPVIPEIPNAPPPSSASSTPRQTGVIEIPPPPPLNDAAAPADVKIVSFSSESARVAPGQRTRLLWSVEGATKVTIEPNIGSVDPRGSTFVTLRRTTEYTLIARKANGEVVRKTAVVEVAPQATPPPAPPPPAPRQLNISFQAQQTAIRSGQSTLLRWSVPGAALVMITPGVGRVQAEGSAPVNPAQTTTYTLTARSAGGAASTSEVTVQVEPAYTPPPPPTPPPAPAARPEVTFDVVPNSIQPGGAAVLRWSIRNAHSASITPGPGALTRSVGEFRVSPGVTTTYTLTARAQDGTMATATAMLYVAAPAAPAAPVTRPISVVHDHGILNQYAWPSCYGFLQVVGGNLRYTVSGSTDGRADGFEVPLNEIQEVKTNRLNIRGQTAFHVTIRGQHLNFVARGISAAQAVYQIETDMRPR